MKIETEVVPQRYIILTDEDIQKIIKEYIESCVGIDVVTVNFEISNIYFPSLTGVKVILK